MQTIFGYLGRSGIKGRLIQETALDSSGISVLEPAIELKDQGINIIRLVRLHNYSGSRNILRFQYEISLEKDLSGDLIKKLNARTKARKIGKMLGLFGGKVAGFTWTGQELADVLNRDTEILQGLLSCEQLWGGMVFDIEAISPSRIHILGPWIGDPGTIIELYSAGRSYEEQKCVFGYQTADKIARHIQKMSTLV